MNFLHFLHLQVPFEWIGQSHASEWTRVHPYGRLQIATDALTKAIVREIHVNFDHTFEYLPGHGPAIRFVALDKAQIAAQEDADADNACDVDDSR